MHAYSAGHGSSLFLMETSVLALSSTYLEWHLVKSTYRSGVLQPPPRRLPDLVSDAVAEAHRYGCRLHLIALN